jgi:hypothetical protein
MSDLRHFLRYQIPGLMFFVHLNAFLYGCDIIGIKQLTKLIVPEFFLAVLVGWIIYQIYDTLNLEANCLNSTITKVMEWNTNKTISDTKAKNAIQIGLLTKTVTEDGNKKEILMEELRNVLSKRFDHLASRRINTVINIFAFLGYFYFLISKNSIYFLITTTVSSLIALYLFNKIRLNKKEIQSYESMLIHLKKDEIMEATKL